MWDGYDVERPAARAAVVLASHALEWVLGAAPIELSGAWDSTAGRAFSYDLGQCRRRVAELHAEVLGYLRQLEG